jgi:hypothetical protein
MTENAAFAQAESNMDEENQRRAEVALQFRILRFTVTLEEWLERMEKRLDDMQQKLDVISARRAQRRRQPSIMENNHG